MSQVLTKNRLPRGQCSSLEGKRLVPEEEGTWSAPQDCLSTRQVLPRSGYTPDPQMATMSVPVRIPSPGKGVWSSLSVTKFFLMGIIIF